MPGGDKMIYQSPQMHDIATRVRHTAQRDKDVPILILGETGVGKNMLADYIHYQTPQRCSEPFVEVALSCEDSLLDNELFGYVPNAFTGAAAIGHDGSFKLAKGGTVFLDEIGDISKPAQFKLLKVIDEGKYWPVGASNYSTADVRIIAATNKPTEYLTDATHFRSDLYYRISAETVVIPPLRERIEDVVPLAEHFMNRWNVEHYTSYVLAEYDKALLVGYSFPGNVRELKDVVCHTARFSETDFNTAVLARELSQRRQTITVPKAVFARASNQQEECLLLEKVQQATEFNCIKKALIITNNHHTNAATLLGITRTTLRSKIRLYGLDRPPDNSLPKIG